MSGGEGYRPLADGLFDSCTPYPEGELGLGSPLTKNKSTFSDYHHPDSIAYTPTVLVCHGAPRECGVFRSHPWREGGDVDIGSRLSKVS